MGHANYCIRIVIYDEHEEREREREREREPQWSGEHSSVCQRQRGRRLESLVEEKSWVLSSVASPGSTAEEYHLLGEWWARGRKPVKRERENVCHQVSIGEQCGIRRGGGRRSSALAIAVKSYCRLLWALPSMNTANQRRSSRICGGGGGALRNWGKGERVCSEFGQGRRRRRRRRGKM